MQPEVLDLVNVNEGVSDDEDDGYTGGNTFSNGALKEEPPTPRLSHAMHDPHNTAAYQEAQRLLNQVTKNLSSMSKSATLGGNPAHSPASLMAELRRVGSGEGSDLTRMPMSPLEDESGRAGNTNFLVEMAKMSTSMNGQPVHGPGHMHSLDPVQMDGIAVHDLQAMGIPQPPTPIGNFDFDDEDDEQDEEPLYVNAKQYHRILKRRAARARLEEMNRVVKERKVSHGYKGRRYSAGVLNVCLVANSPISTNLDINTLARALEVPEDGSLPLQKSPHSRQKKRPRQMPSLVQRSGLAVIPLAARVHLRATKLSTSMTLSFALRKSRSGRAHLLIMETDRSTSIGAGQGRLD